MTTITQERAALAKVPGAPPMRRREQWGARFNYTNSRPVDEPATRVFVHITITNPGDFSSNDLHARRVENIGINRFPATGISYNRLVMPDGSLYEGQPIGRRGAHTVNDFRRSTCTTLGCPGRGSSLTAPSWNLNVNARSYVICQNTQHVVTDKMVDTIARAIAADYLAGFITKAAAQNIHGHRCVSAKGCPGDRMWARMKEIQSRVNQLIAQGPTEKGDDDMFTDADREMLRRLNNVIASNSDEKIERPDADGTAGMRFALQESWEDTHELTERVPWQSPSVHNYVRDVLGWKDSADPTKASLQKTRYLIELAFWNSDRIWKIVSDPTALAAALAPLLPAGNAPTREQLETALKSVLGSLDDPANPT